MENPYVLWIVAIVIYRTLLGFLAQYMISKKGYDENWAIWGFLFGFIAIIIILIKPDNKNNANKVNENTPQNNIWTCVFCKNKNSEDICTCGKTKSDTIKAIRAYKIKQKQLQNIELLKKYKELLDTGVINQSEFEAKKKELLN